MSYYAKLGALALMLSWPAAASAQTAPLRDGAGAAPVAYVRFEHGGSISYGILEGQTIRVLDGSPLEGARPTGRTVSAAEVVLLTPVDPSRVSKVVGTAVNTKRPGLELPPDAHPRWFAKFPTSLSATNGEVELPPEAGNLNYEGELVVVIGKPARHVPRERALDYVFGYAVGNDFSENTWYGERQGREEPSRLISKGMDSWAALGPQLVTGIDYRGRRLVTRLNGEIVQDGTTDDLIQNVPELISNLSRYVTLLPGDLIYTGTVLFGEGVRRQMRAGDVLDVEIDGIGSVRSRIVPMDTTAATGAGAGAGAAGAAFAFADSGAPPRYEVDAAWPQPLPNRWILGQVSGVDVDAEGHVWIVQRPRTLSDRENGAAQDPPIAECCVPAPPVIELDAEGNVLRAWGGKNDRYHWPDSEHGLYVDPDGHIWIASNGRGDNVVMKFTPDGELLLTIGEPGESGGSNDTRLLAGPTDVAVDAEAGEVYVADGYRNRRVIVFDAATGEYRRHWGAYGERPDDSVELGPYDPDAPVSRHFRSAVHAVPLSRDGLVYVADRANNRIQVFRPDGTFVREGFVARRTLGTPLAWGAVWDLAFSPDAEQRFLYVADGTNMKVWILDRADLAVLGSFGRAGRYAGEFEVVHNVAVAPDGSVYVTEVNTGKRVQRFRPVP